MNDNTIAGVYGAPKQVLNTVTETLLGPTGAPLAVTLSPNVRVDGHAFAVNLRGKATGGTAATLLLKLYLASADTIGTSTAVAAFTVTGALIPVAGGTFDLSFQFIWDSVSNTMRGMVWGRTDGTITPFATTAAVAMTDPTTLSFVASATFGAAVATNSVTVTEFTIDQV